MASKKVALLQEEFIKRHKAWEKVNNPDGFRNGHYTKCWDARTKALLELVHAQQRYEKIVRNK